MNKSRVFLLPTVLHEDEHALNAIPQYITDAVKQCHVFFAENERTARRFFKKIWKEMVIDDYVWYSIHKVEEEVKSAFLKHIAKGDTIGIISEAGCPGIADPGQLLVELAQSKNVNVQPLTGPNSIILALMASGMNGQKFSFHGYLPVDAHERKKTLKQLESVSAKEGSTQIFIETPYRNNQLINDMLSTLNGNTRLCVAVDITSASEFIKTKFIKEWKQQPHDFHKRPAIFLLQA